MDKKPSKYRKVIVYLIAITVSAITGYTMPEGHYKIFLDAFTVITCGFFIGNSVSKFGKGDF